MSPRRQGALSILVTLVGGIVAWKSFDSGHWLIGAVASAGANLGAVWALIQRDRTPRRGPKRPRKAATP